VGFRHGQKVVDCRYVVYGLGQNADLNKDKMA
jgi:hypothetical protein